MNNFQNIFGPKAKGIGTRISESFSLTKQIINSIYGRTPVFFNNALAEEISPVVDTTLYMPLQFQIKSITIDAIENSINTFSFRPPNDKHWIIDHAAVNNINGVACTTTLVLQHQNGTEVIGLGTWYTEPLPVAHIYPIGGVASYYDGTSVINVPSIRNNLYLQPTDLLQVITTVPMGSSGGIKAYIRYLELPLSQPFGSLFAK